MWLLPSRGRPAACQEALDAIATHGTAPGVLYVHETFEDYADIRLPPGWTKHEGMGAQAAQMQWFYAEHPNEKWYGWIADDNRPLTPDFDIMLAEEAEDRYFVFCNGGRHKTNKKYRGGVPTTIPSAMVWGGDLVRAVGWWAPPWIVHATIDEHWKYICTRANRSRYRHDVVVEHLHWITGLRKQDKTDLTWVPGLGMDVDVFNRMKPWLDVIAGGLK